MLPFERPTLSVSDLCEDLRAFLREGFSDIWVQGESQRVHRSQRGHVYFEMVEKGQGDRIVAKIDCVIWSRDASRIGKKLAGEPLVAEGREMRCHGRVDFYAAGGRLQLVVQDVDPEFALGRLALRRKETLEALVAAGLMERNRSLPLDQIPLRIGLVTSKDSAAYHDFLGTLGEGGYRFEVLFVHAAVQGKEAEREVTSALDLLATQNLDCVVLTRGGGSRSDLAAFDSRSIAEAVARAPFPILSGLGHEIDQAVTDLVAHSALRTPTKAAEFLVERVALADSAWRELADRARYSATKRIELETLRVRGMQERLRRSGNTIRRESDRLGSLAKLLSQGAERNLKAGGVQLISLRTQLASTSQFRIQAAREAVLQRGLRVASGSQARTRQARVLIDGLSRLADQLGPERILKRGFSITRDEQGRILRKAGDVQPGQTLRTQLSDGEIKSRLESP